MKAKVAINGYGTIGKRVADAVAAQDDMEVVGVVKTRPSFEASIAKEKGFPLYAAAKENLEDFKKSKIEVSGTLEELLDEADIVIDATPGDTGKEYKKLYQKHDVKAIWQGGEDHELTEFSFNSEANYDDALGRNLARVVSCNTTGLVRVLYALDTAYGVRKARATLMRRAADPNDIKTGPINALVPDPIKLPSHHGPDVNSILPEIDITTMAVKTSTTLMHLHALNIELENKCVEDDIINLFGKRPRI
ncbi:MAG: type II glyceraldehyde-3-phosphate dehydrogenase, partial [Candidatus Methanoperedens sp.]|nr:type II glyceraldehyde-3-phosphate dehydrogenase [Candidatus Methanoperedens sp.]